MDTNSKNLSNIVYIISILILCILIIFPFITRFTNENENVYILILDFLIRIGICYALVGIPFAIDFLRFGMLISLAFTIGFLCVGMLIYYNHKQQYMQSATTPKEFRNIKEELRPIKKDRVDLKLMDTNSNHNKNFVSVLICFLILFPFIIRFTNENENVYILILEFLIKIRICYVIVKIQPFTIDFLWFGMLTSLVSTMGFLWVAMLIS